MKVLDDTILVDDIIELIVAVDVCVIIIGIARAAGTWKSVMINVGYGDLMIWLVIHHLT